MRANMEDPISPISDDDLKAFLDFNEVSVLLWPTTIGENTIVWNERTFGMNSFGDVIDADMNYIGAYDKETKKIKRFEEIPRRFREMKLAAGYR